MGKVLESGGVFGDWEEQGFWFGRLLGFRRRNDNEERKNEELKMGRSHGKRSDFVGAIFLYKLLCITYTPSVPFLMSLRKIVSF